MLNDWNVGRDAVFAHYVIDADGSDKIWMALHELNISSTSCTNQTFRFTSTQKFFKVNHISL